MKASELLREYLKSKRRTLLLFAVSAVISSVIFFLWRLPVAAVAYTLLVCLVPAGLIAARSFITFRRNHLQLSGILAQSVNAAERLPAPDNLIERDYSELVRLLCGELENTASAAESQAAAAREYYTTWVHQIKTPIAALRLLLADCNTPESKELIWELQRIEGYVEMVLCFIRLGSDSTDYVIREYDLDDIIKSGVRKFASQFIRKKLSLEYEALNYKVLTDEKWLLFVIEQVLSNALKYTSHGSIKISMEEPDTLCIRDTGIGIDPSELPRIFEDGFTGGNGRIDGRSSGLGLNLCKKITSRLGHTICAESVPTVGTVIKIGLGHSDMAPE